MVEKYYLNGEVLPTMPVPHDCVVKEITFDDEFLVLKFDVDISHHDPDISYYDSITSINKNASALVIRIHLTDPLFYAYEHRMTHRFSGEGYYLINNKKLQSLCKKCVEYLYHYVSYEQIMIKLFCGGYYLLEVTSDYIEFDWTEK